MADSRTPQGMAPHQVRLGQRENASLATTRYQQSIWCSAGIKRR